MTEPITIGNGNNKWIKDADTKMLTITTRYNVGAGYKSLVTSGTTTAYQVPVGKKFIILSCVSSEYTANLNKHTVVNATGGTQLFFYKHPASGTSFGAMDLYVEVEAGKYINTYTNDYGVVITGVETNV